MVGYQSHSLLNIRYSSVKDKFTMNPLATLGVRRTTIPLRGTDYCFMDTFVAQCSSGTRIQINEALLGMMRISKCMSEDKHGGCYDVVTDDVEEKCEGKTRCEFYVGGLGSLVRNCPTNSGVMPYLNVWHECVEGIVFLVFIIVHWSVDFTTKDLL